MISEKRWPKGGGDIELVNEVRPVDLFCYLGARFGPPNGIQNFLRRDDSANLIHWDWTLRHADGLASFMGMNFRTEVRVHGPVILDDTDRARLVGQLKQDFGAHGKGMGEVRKHLEPWVEFVNPYQRIRRAIDRLLGELDGLKLDPANDRVDDIWALRNDPDLGSRWQEAGSRYQRGFSLSFAIRSMLPVLAESYVNLLLFILLRPELRADTRLNENVVRQPIDVRIKSLSINCIGFAKQPDYSSEPCRRYHRLVNERNDLLHGNVVVDKLKFNEVFFLGKVPVFRSYRSMWQRSLDIEMQAVGLENVRPELAVVDGLVGYLESCLTDPVRRDMVAIAGQFELGLNSQTDRIGILFPGLLADMRSAPVFREEDASSDPDAPPA